MNELFYNFKIENIEKVNVNWQISKQIVVTE